MTEELQAIVDSNRAITARAKKDPRNWSFSRIDGFQRCHRQNGCAYLWQLPVEASSDIGDEGSLFHAAAEKLARICIDKGVPQSPAAGGRIEAALATRNVGLANTFAKWAERTEFDCDTTMARGGVVEHWMEASLPGGDEEEGDRGIYRGKVDRLMFDARAELLTVIDYKAGWAVADFDEDNPPLQIAGYGWLASQEVPDSTRIKLVVEYVRRGIFHEWFLRRPLKRIENALAERVDEIVECSSRDWKQITPGSHCDWCAWKISCEIDTDGLQIVGDDEAARSAWAAANGLSQQARGLKKGVGQYVEAAGPVVDGDKEIGYHMPASANPEGRVLAVRPGQEIAFLTLAQKMGKPPSALINSFKTGALESLIGGSGGQAEVDWMDMFFHEVEAKPSLRAAKRAPEPEEEDDDE